MVAYDMYEERMKMQRQEAIREMQKEQRGINSVNKALEFDAQDDEGVGMSVEETLAERGERYGDFSDHARIAQELQDVMRKFEAFTLRGVEVPWRNLSPVQKQALTVIADKIARILSGDPNYKDNWHDIQGYAKLVEDRLP